MPMIQMRKTHPKQNRDSNLWALGTHRKTTTTLVQYCFEAYCSLCIYPPASLLDPAIKTVWPSCLRRWLKAQFGKGVGSNPTAVILICHRVQIKTRQYESSTVWRNWLPAITMTTPNLTQNIRRAKFDMQKYLQINGDHAFTNRNSNSKDTFENMNRWSQRLKKS